MSAELLRRAAAQLRKDWDNDDDRRTFPKAAAYNLAVADWLEVEAARLHRLDIDGTFNAYQANTSRALTVARAYLEESA